MSNARLGEFSLTTILTVAALLPSTAASQTIKVGVVQTTHENTLEKNVEKVIRFICQAKQEGCDLVVFDENALYEAVDIQVLDNPTVADLDAAVARVGETAKEENIYVLFSMSHKKTDDGAYRNRACVYDAQGNRRVFYWKGNEVPESFDVRGVPTSVLICSDRFYLEHSDLPTLTQGVKFIVDTSGGHGGDDGRPDLRLIRYRPWAARNNVYVAVCNPVHDETDFMGNSPYGGNCAIINPDGSIQARLHYEKDVILTGIIDPERATRTGAKARREHAIFRSFWDKGKTLLEGGSIEPVPDIEPYTSAARGITILAAQIACSRDIEENTRTIVEDIGKAAAQGADVVVFPALAVTGNRDEDIAAATQAELDEALGRIRAAARAAKIHAIVGMPYFEDGVRQNCALAIGDDGTIQTRYAQIAPGSSELFTPGMRTKAMWFTVDGVYSIVTIGEDANRIELGDLAANRGMSLHFHLDYAVDASPDRAELRRQRDLLALRYAQFGVSVNAADPSNLASPSGPASGGSIIVSREGGHNRPRPEDVELYLPYQTSIVKSVGEAATMFAATRKIAARNPYDIEKRSYNRNRRHRDQEGWFDWIKAGTWLIEAEAPALRGLVSGPPASGDFPGFALCRRGHPIDVDVPPDGMDRKEFDRQHQRAEFLKSIEYLRRWEAK